jgi:hypothetical protein
MHTHIPLAEKRSSRTKPRRAWAVTVLAVALTVVFAPVGGSGGRAGEDGITYSGGEETQHPFHHG